MDVYTKLMIIALVSGLALLIIGLITQSSSTGTGGPKSHVATARDVERARRNLAQLAGGIQAAQTAAANCKATVTIVQVSEPHLTEKQWRVFSQHQFAVRAQETVKSELVRTRKTCQQTLGRAGPFEPQFLSLLVRLFEAERACADCTVRDDNGSECRAQAVLSMIEVEQPRKESRKAGREMEE